MARKPFPEASADGEAFIAGLEGDIPYVYDDAVFPTRPYKRGEAIRGNLTGGTGHLLSRRGPGGKVSVFPEAWDWIGKTIPQRVRRKWLDEDLDDAERAVHDLVRVHLSARQRDVLISFVFNVGRAAFARSTLLRKLNAGDHAGAAAQLGRWTKTTIDGRKVTSRGLVKRRALELAYWNGSNAVPVHTEDEPSGTQIAEPEARPTAPGELVAAGGGLLGALAAFATSTGPVAWAFFFAIVVGVLLAAFVFVRRQLAPR